jgi:hypothetical protein
MTTTSATLPLRITLTGRSPESSRASSTIVPFISAALTSSTTFTASRSSIPNSNRPTDKRFRLIRVTPLVSGIHLKTQFIELADV